MVEEPNISKELKAILKSKGTYDAFIKDYQYLSEHFRYPKLYLPSEEETPPVPYENLSPEEKNKLEKHGKKYADTLHQLLELAVKLNKDHKKYAILGGMCVVAHLYKHHPNFVRKFRGTADIDLLSLEEGGLETYYHDIGFEKVKGGERINPKYGLISYTKHFPSYDDPIKIQDRKKLVYLNYNLTKKAAKEIESIELYGVPVNVLSEKYIKETKTIGKIGRTRTDIFGYLKDLHDIYQIELIERYEKKIGKRK